MNQVTIRLEAPFNEQDAKRRAIDPSFCKIIFECQTKNDRICLSQIATAIYSCCSMMGNAYITAVSEFVPVDTLEQIDGVTIFKTNNLVNTESEAALESVMALWDAEALVIFFSDAETAKAIVSSVARLNDQWWRYKKGSYDHDFLCQIELCRLFIFYSSTHRSIEIIGHEQEILSCYECLQKNRNAGTHIE